MELKETDEAILLSVIVTVYNCGAYLAECLESIINQTFRRLEIIIIDDGSTDESENIYTFYAQKDTRIHIFKQKNAGLVSARCHGIAMASGEYITFVDGDDWIEAEMYHHLLAPIKKASYDVVTSGLRMDYESGRSCMEMDLVKEGEYKKASICQDIIPVMMYGEQSGRRFLTSSLCNKIIKKTVLRKVMRYVNPQLTYGEDALWTYTLIAAADSIFVEKHAWYHYRVHPDSMVHTFDIDSFEKIRLLQTELKKAFTDLDIWAQLRPQVDFYIRLFLQEAVQAIYGLRIELFFYMFPFRRITAGSRVILYGAGHVGQDYYRNLIKSGYAKVVGWVDRDGPRLTINSVYRIELPENILQKQYDWIVIAVDAEGTAAEIVQALCSIGIKKEQIIWEKPKRVLT